MTAFTLGCHSCHTTTRNDLKRRAYALANDLQERVVGRPGAIRHVHGPANVATGPRELVVLSIGRDAAPWIDALIEHHLSLGAKHVFFLDNGSRDDTVARACRHERVSVFSTDIEFRRYEVGLRRWIVRTFGRDRWSLYVDADELFAWPCADRLPLAGFLGYLEAHGYKAVAGQMLDLFSDKPFSRLATEGGGPLQEEYRWYDLSDLIRTQDVYWMRDGQLANRDIPCYFGGIRKRFFGDDCLLLTKHPLVHADAGVGVYTYDGHFVTRAPVADVSTALLHYKYIGSLPERVRVTVDEQWHNKVAALYGGLADALARDPDLCLRRPTARELRGVDELVDNGFLHVTQAYLDWVDAHGAGRGATGERHAARAL